MTISSDGIFHDVLEYEGTSKDFALDSNLLQVDRGVPTIRHDCIYLEHLTLRRFHLSHTLLDGFRVRDGWTSFVLAPTVENNAVWNGTKLVPNVLGILRSGIDHEALIPAGWSTVEVDVADHLIASEGLLPESVFTGAVTPKKGLLCLNAPVAAATRRELSALFGQDTLSASTLLSGDPALALRRRVLDLLAAAVGHGCRETTHLLIPSIFHAHRQVRKACALLDQQLQGNPSIESVALELGVTTRSLRRCFLSVLSVSPKQYVMARKLDFAHRALRLRGQRTSVIDIAYEFGFVSASRFTEQFKRQFGQAPSTVTRLTPHPLSPSL